MRSYSCHPILILPTEGENGNFRYILHVLHLPATVSTARSLSTSSVGRNFETGLSFCPILRWSISGSACRLVGSGVEIEGEIEGGEIGWKEAEKEEEERVEWENEVDEGGKEDDKEKEEEGGRIEGAHGLTGDDFSNRSVSSIWFRVTALASKAAFVVFFIIFNNCPNMSSRCRNLLALPP